MDRMSSREGKGNKNCFLIEVNLNTEIQTHFKIDPF